MFENTTRFHRKNYYGKKTISRNHWWTISQF
ncbi:hypothetical protein X777_00038 [Ooceraea biroi]|uniref:Uncharacterized protein n=1 Tax=Ooceraea biroi TaxID=2015173 RepID=A0A026VST9_OOCBI|nr:hypothetical protein X777_00038 [Ooceraea biroi]